MRFLSSGSIYHSDIYVNIYIYNVYIHIIYAAHYCAYMFPSPLGSVLTISQSASSQGLARWQGHSANPAWTPPSCQAVWGVHPCGRCNLQMNPRKTSRLKTSGRRTYVIWYHMIIWCMIYVRICVRMTVIAKSQKSCTVKSSVNRMINTFNGIDIEQTYPWACLYKNP